jgi:single-stranded-DNA-specific exonuclease
MIGAKRWKLKPLPRPEVVVGLTHDRCPPMVARLLAQRGIESPAEASIFFRPHASQLHDPFLMADMQVAVERVERALGDGERIMVFGDYDVDGTTAVALVYHALARFTGNLIFHIPDRYKEGYGISTIGIDRAAQEGATLIIALDCGIKAHDKVRYAAAKGIDMIICDHHMPSDTLPEAVAVLDPKRPDCAYPFKELSGCSVGFKLMQGVAARNGIAFGELEPLLDLVAVSTACDIVPVTGENRVLAAMGLQRLNRQPRPGLKALLQAANVKRELGVTDLVFTLGPRINAAGRVEHGKLAVELLLSKNLERAEDVAKRINRNNSQRQDLDKEMTRQAMEQANTIGFGDTWSTVVYDAQWHKGVVGIVASRLVDSYYKPTVVLTHHEGKATGSARSVPGFDLYEAISACSDLLEQFGGHKYAAGLSMPVENVEAFRVRFEQVVRSTLPVALRTPEEEADLEIELDAITEHTVRVIERMGPFGPQHLRPVFLTRNLMTKGTPRLVGDGHLKMTLFHPSDRDRTLDAIAFRQGEALELVQGDRPFSVMYSLESNEWNGRRTIQMNVKDIKAGVSDEEILPSKAHVQCA